MLPITAQSPHVILDNIESNFQQTASETTNLELNDKVGVFAQSFDFHCCIKIVDQEKTDLEWHIQGCPFQQPDYDFSNGIHKRIIKRYEKAKPRNNEKSEDFPVENLKNKCQI